MVTRTMFSIIYSVNIELQCIIFLHIIYCTYWLVVQTFVNKTAGGLIMISKAEYEALSESGKAAKLMDVYAAFIQCSGFSGKSRDSTAQINIAKVAIII